MAVEIDSVRLDRPAREGEARDCNDLEASPDKDGEFEDPKVALKLDCRWRPPPRPPP